MIRQCPVPSTPLCARGGSGKSDTLRPQHRDTHAILQFARRTRQRNRNELSETTVNKTGRKNRHSKKYQ
jgi:hypothetical protein